LRNGWLESPSDLQARPRRFYAAVASGPLDVRAAQRLRYRVFGEEMGVKLNGSNLGLDLDPLDDYCDHLLVWDDETEVAVGTYRILTPHLARVAGGFYSESEFDLSRLAPLRDRVAEVGRACVHPDYRRGAVIKELWSGLLEYLIRGGFEYAMGCASIPTTDGGHTAATLCRRLLQEHLGPEEQRVFPRRAFVMEGWDEVANATFPPLIKGYLRIGAHVCGNPAWDPSFRTADLLLLLSITNMSGRYVERLCRSF
jgi:putative hemolysin